MEDWLLLQLRTGSGDANGPVSTAVDLFLRSKWLDPINTTGSIIEIGPRVRALVPRRIGRLTISEPMVLNAAGAAQRKFRDHVERHGPAINGAWRFIRG